MVQPKLVRNLHPCLPDSFFNTILDRKRWFSIGEGDIVASPLQFLAEGQGWISWACPLPVAEKMKDLHSVECLSSIQDLEGLELKEEVIVLNFFKVVDISFGMNELF
jgi:hypothetical protein